LIKGEIYGSFSAYLIAFLFYILLVLLYTLAIKNYTQYIFLPAKKPRVTRIINSSGFTSPAISRSPGLRANGSNLVSESEPSPKKKKKMAIPKYLMKLNDDFFATVTAK
jgi:hypothetical protein